MYESRIYEEKCQVLELLEKFMEEIKWDNYKSDLKKCNILDVFFSQPSFNGKSLTLLVDDIMIFNRNPKFPDLKFEFTKMDLELKIVEYNGNTKLKRSFI